MRLLAQGHKASRPDLPSSLLGPFHCTASPKVPPPHIQLQKTLVLGVSGGGARSCVFEEADTKAAAQAQQQLVATLHPAGPPTWCLARPLFPSPHGFSDLPVTPQPHCPHFP